MKSFMLFVLFFTFLPLSSAQLVISEIMYNPSTMQGNDADLEWVELYNPTTRTVNLTDFVLDGNTIQKHVLLQPQAFVVLARDLLDGNHNNNSFEIYYGNGDGVWNATDGHYETIDVSMSLRNSGDTVILGNGTHTVYAFSYASSLGGDGNGHTLIMLNLSWSNATDNYGEGLFNGTPGFSRNNNLFLDDLTNLTLELFSPIFTQFTLFPENVTFHGLVDVLEDLGVGEGNYTQLQAWRVLNNITEDYVTLFNDHVFDAQNALEQAQLHVYNATTFYHDGLHNQSLLSYEQSLHFYEQFHNVTHIINTLIWSWRPLPEQQEDNQPSITVHVPEEQQEATHKRRGGKHYTQHHSFVKQTFAQEEPVITEKTQPIIKKSTVIQKPLEKEQAITVSGILFWFLLFVVTITGSVLVARRY